MSISVCCIAKKPIVCRQNWDSSASILPWRPQTCWCVQRYGSNFGRAGFCRCAKVTCWVQKLRMCPTCIGLLLLLTSFQSTGFPRCWHYSWSCMWGLQFLTHFLPKFYCKLNFIEQCWGYAKWLCQLNPESLREDHLERNALAALDVIPLTSMRQLVLQCSKFSIYWEWGLLCMGLVNVSYTLSLLQHFILIDQNLI